MIGLWALHAQTFLLALGALTIVLFSIPIAFAPLFWARLVGWDIPEKRDLAIYFGRCLGAFALILNFFMLRAGLTGEGVRPTYEFMAMVWAFMIVVHIVGAIQRVQPIVETLEIGFWILLALMTAAFWPVAG